MCRIPQALSNSTHGSFLQWGCDVPSFNIPWLYNGTWVTFHGASCSLSPSVYPSPLLFWWQGVLILYLSPGQIAVVRGTERDTEQRNKKLSETFIVPLSQHLCSSIWQRDILRIHTHKCALILRHSRVQWNKANFQTCCWFSSLLTPSCCITAQIWWWHARRTPCTFQLFLSPVSSRQQWTESKERLNADMISVAYVNFSEYHMMNF